MNRCESWAKKQEEQQRGLQMSTKNRQESCGLNYDNYDSYD